MEQNLIGTLYEPEEIDQKQNFYNQVARDHLGHKRFHGAFTGGFEAGYKNTCGTKEGFQTKQFISSVKDRAKYKQQSVLDFMDEEDIGITKIGEGISTKQEYDTLGQQQKDILQQNLGQNQHLGNAPNELIFNSQNLIGKSILMNQSKNQEIKKKVKILEQNIIPEKNNYFGLGFDENKDYEDEFEKEIENEFKIILRKYKKNEEETFKTIEQQKEAQRIKLSNIYENEDNYYEDSYKIEYNKFETQNQTTTEKIEKKVIKIDKIKNIFQKAKNQQQIQIQKVYLDVPKDFDPFKKVKTAVQAVQNKKQLNYKQRNSLLEDGMNKNVSSDLKQKILNVKKFVKGDVQEMNEFDIRAHLDKDRQIRYENYKLGKKDQLNLTQIEYAKEIIEFEEIFKLEEKAKKIQKIEELQNLIKKEREKRIIVQWNPNHLLCKRFGVIPPYRGKNAPIQEQSVRPDRFESEIMPLYLSNKPVETAPEPKIQDIKVEDLQQKKPEKSLFKSIFDDDEDDL